MAGERGDIELGSSKRTSPSFFLRASSSSRKKKDTQKLVTDEMSSTSKMLEEMEGEINIQQVDREWCKQVEERIFKPTTRERTLPCTIYKLHNHTKDNHLLQAAQVPKVVSIGPYHRHIPDLKPMEEIKFICLGALLRQCRVPQPIDHLLAQMKTAEEIARNSYSESVLMGSNEFAEMLLVDGCFIIYLLLMVAEKEMITSTLKDRSPTKKVNIAGEETAIFRILGSWNMIRCDIIMLDNQIPFLVIEALWLLLDLEDLRPELLAINLFRDLHPFQTLNYSSERVENIFLENFMFHHLLHLIHCIVISPFPENDNESENVQEWIPSAIELREAGIQFKAKIESKGFSDITFCNGVIEVPPLHMYDYSVVLFKNLIDFENCFPNVHQYVTTYVRFIDGVLRSSEDLRLLQRKAIIVNRLGSDEEVTKFFNGISAHIHHVPKRHYLQGLYSEVSTYRLSRIRKWKADLERKYCNSPWKSISVLAAFILLLLTAVQTAHELYPFEIVPNHTGNH